MPLERVFEADINRVYQMKEHIVRAVVGIGAIASCAILAYGVHCFLPQQSPSGLAFGVLGALVITVGLQLRRAMRWQLGDFLLSLAGAEVIAALFDVGLSLVSPHFHPWAWFARVTLFITLPWALGYVLGSISLLAIERQKPVFVRSWVLAGVYMLGGLMAFVLIPELRNTYRQFATPLPSITLFLIRVSPDLWYFLGLGFAGLTIAKDLRFRQRWLDHVLPIAAVPLTLALFLPLL